MFSSIMRQCVPTKTHVSICTETYVVLCVMRISGRSDVKDTIKKLKQDTEPLKQPFLLAFSSSGICASDHTLHQIFLVLSHQFLMLPFSLLKAIVILFLSFFAFGLECPSCVSSVYALVQLMVSV